MNFNFKRLLNTELGKIFISIFLGFGLACLFQHSCNEKNCIRFQGAVITEIDDKIYKHDEKCYKYVAQSTSCNSNKKIIDVSEPKPID
jgi:hypothetical protein